MRLLLMLLVGLLVMPITAQEQAPVIAPENAALLTQVGTVGYGRINDLTYSPDGNQVAVATATGVLLFDPTFQNPRRLDANGNMQAIAWSSNGVIVVGDSNGGLIVWDAVSGERRLLISGHDGAINDVVFTLDGTQFATGGDDGTVRIWDSNDGTEVFRLAGHTASVLSVDWSLTGELASASEAEVMRWNLMLNEGRMLNAGYRDFVSWSPNGRFLLTQGTNGLALLDGMTDAEMAAGFADRVITADFVSVAWSPDSSQFVFGTRDWVSVLDGVTLAERLPLYTGQFPSSDGDNELGATFAADWSPLRPGIITAHADATLRVWNAIDGNTLSTVAGFSGATEGVAWSPDASMVYIASSDGLAFAWPTLNTWTQQGQHLLSRKVDVQFGLAFAVSSAQVAVVGDNLTQHDVNSLEEVGRQPLNDGISGVSAAYSPDGSRLALVVAEPNSNTGTLLVLDLITGAELFRTAVDPVVGSVAWTSDNTLIVLTGAQADLMAIDLAANSQQGIPTSGVYQQFVVPDDGNRIALFSEDGRVLILNAVAGGFAEQPYALPLVNLNVAHDWLDISPDGRVLALAGQTADGRNAVLVIDAQSGAQLAQINTTREPISDVAFSPTGQTLAVATSNGNVTLWQVP
jgi:WD40 repeat protein